MCAIAGLIGLPPKDSVSIMLETMKRRGPDGQGAFVDRETVLLHTRLAVIDPAGGKQPMELFFESEHYTITYNGELYNTQELRDILQAIGLLQILIRKWYCTLMPNGEVTALKSLTAFLPLLYGNETADDCSLPGIGWVSSRYFTSCMRMD